jgi:xanthosine utilization system XapX-like protein
MVEKQAEDGTVLVQQYRGVMAMIQQNYTRRTATNRFYISIGSGLLVFLTYAVNPSVDIEIQSVAATMVAVVGLVLCLVWGLQIRALRGLIDIQIKLAQEMEQSLPFDFFCRQEELLIQPGRWLKYGVVEQGLPVLISLPYLLILGAVYFYY